jgi:hypothetical protein
MACERPVFAAPPEMEAEVMTHLPAPGRPCAIDGRADAFKKSSRRKL